MVEGFSRMLALNQLLLEAPPGVGVDLVGEGFVAVQARSFAFSYEVFIFVHGEIFAVDYNLTIRRLSVVVVVCVFEIQFSFSQPNEVRLG